MTEEKRTYLFELLEKQFGKMSARERLIAGSIIDEAANLATKELQKENEKMKCCGNCENRYGQEKCADCHNYSKWKFKQAEQFYEETAE